MHCSLLSLGCVFGFSTPQEQGTLTALRALKVAQRRLRPEVRSRLLSISSPRTDFSLHPEAWRFVFHDAGTSGNSRIVTVAAKASSEHPQTVEAFSGDRVEDSRSLIVVPQNKLIFDSSHVLDQARQVLKMKGLQSAQYKLSQPKNAREPVWTLNFYGELGEIIVSFRIGAKSGELVMVGDVAPGDSQEVISPQEHH